MSPIRPSKRRRLDNASHTLSQPFKSPFKTPLKPKTSADTNLLFTTPSPNKETPYRHEHPRPKSPPPRTSHPPTTTPFRRPHPPVQNNPPSSSQYHTLQKQHTHLLNALSASRTSLETSTQALKIETSNREPELETLIQKWKLASRAAAEEVFAKARDRVNKMGGVGAMRDREKEGRERAWGWDDQPTKESGNGEGEEGEEGAGFRGGEYEGEERDEREEGAKRGEDEAGDEEEGYTMDMMLKALNIELDVIGFDKGVQKWVD